MGKDVERTTPVLASFAGLPVFVAPILAKPWDLPPDKSVTLVLPDV